MVTHWNIKVHGKVQGVFYRANTKKKADSLNIAGHVINNPDGTVTIEAEGTEEALELLLQWCKKGPEQASVTKVEKEEKSPQGLEGFTIAG